jgi:hypothetical protein
MAALRGMVMVAALSKRDKTEYGLIHGKKGVKSDPLLSMNPIPCRGGRHIGTS